MKHIHWLAGVLTLFLVACGGQPPGDGDGPPGGPVCQQTLSGDFTVPTGLRNITGDASTCDYYIPNPGSGDHTVNVGAALNIGPGTLIRVADNVRIRIGAGGSINALGTAAERVMITGETTEQGSWYGLCFASGYGDSHIDYTDILWAGNLWVGQASSVCNGSISGVSSNQLGQVHVTNSLIFGSYTSGISTFGLNLGSFSNNVLAGNRLYGASISAANIGQLEPGDYLGNTAGTPNGRPFVHISGTLNQAAGEHTWRNLDAPYFVTTDASNIVITAGVTVNIEAGTRFVMDEGTSFGIWDGASLNAPGTVSDPIIFAGAAETPGYWDGLRFRGSGPSTLEHVEVAWAGGDAAAGLTYGSIYIYRPGGSGVIRLHDLTVRGSSTCGVLASMDGDHDQGVSIERPAFPDHNDGFDELCGPFQQAGG